MSDTKGQSAFHIIFALEIGFTFLLCSCQTCVFWYQERWYSNTKESILRQTKLQADSVANVFSRDSTERDENLFFNKKLFLQRHYRYQSIVFESYHAQTNNFELRREVCEDGSLSFEGVFVGDEPYGISTWWDCNSKLRMEGVRYKNERVGEWMFRNNDLPGTEIKDYGHFELATSMPAFTE